MCESMLLKCLRSAVRNVLFCFPSSYHSQILKCMFGCQNDVLPRAAYVNVDSKSDHLSILTRTGQVAQATGVPWGYLRVKWCCHGQPHSSVCLSGEVNSIEATIFHILYWYLVQGLLTWTWMLLIIWMYVASILHSFPYIRSPEFNISWG